MINLIEKRKEVNKLLTDLSSVNDRYKEEKENLIELEDKFTYANEAQDISQQIAQTIQKQAHDKIANVVSSCLRSVFNDDDVYGFKIHFDKKRGRTEARIVLTKNGHEIDDALNSDSGGVVEVAAFALRLSCIILSKPTLRRILILDEPFRCISKEYQENARILLEKLSKDFKTQFIMVTHNDAYHVGKVIKLL
jgi:ABC-type dipeptide/oligopeptide/nickel transport system ATPase component